MSTRTTGRRAHTETWHVDRTCRLRAIEKENARPNKPVADQVVELVILKEVARENL